MYTQGENFYYDIGGEELELHVLEIVAQGDKEYLITEDLDGKIHVFAYDEELDDIDYVDDRREARDIIEYWKDEYLLANDIGDYDGDEYYDREDLDIDGDYYDEEDYYHDDDDY